MQHVYRFKQVHGCTRHSPLPSADHIRVSRLGKLVKGVTSEAVHKETAKGHSVPRQLSVWHIGVAACSDSSHHSTSPRCHTPEPSVNCGLVQVSSLEDMSFACTPFGAVQRISL